MASALPRFHRTGGPRQLNLGDAVTWDEVPTLAASLAHHAMVSFGLRRPVQPGVPLEAPDTAANSVLDGPLDLDLSLCPPLEPPHLDTGPRPPSASLKSTNCTSQRSSSGFSCGKVDERPPASGPPGVRLARPPHPSALAAGLGKPGQGPREASTIPQG